MNLSLQLDGGPADGALNLEEGSLLILQLPADAETFQLLASTQELTGTTGTFAVSVSEQNPIAG